MILVPLKNLNSLRFLSLNNNRIADLNPIGNLTNLTFLNLINNSFNDVLVLSKFI